MGYTMGPHVHELTTQGRDPPYGRRRLGGAWRTTHAAHIAHGFTYDGAASKHARRGVHAKRARHHRHAAHHRTEASARTAPRHRRVETNPAGDARAPPPPTDTAWPTVGSEGGRVRSNPLIAHGRWESERTRPTQHAKRKKNGGKLEWQEGRKQRRRHPKKPWDRPPPQSGPAFSDPTVTLSPTDRAPTPRE